MRQNQSGTLYEFYIISVLLIISGILLTPVHPAFLILVVAGIVLPVLPATLELLHTLRISAQAKRHWKTLCARGFTPAVQLRSRVREGGAYLAIDSGANQAAFITSEGSRVVELSAVKEILLKTHRLSRWGQPDRTRYDVYFTLKDNTDGFGLSYPGKRKAEKAVKKLRKVLDGRLMFVGQWQK